MPTRKGELSIDKIIDTEEELTESQYQKRFSSGGSSKYEQFIDIASDLDYGERRSFKGVTENQVSGIRTQVYKLNDDDAEENEDREFIVEQTRLTKDGEDVLIRKENSDGEMKEYEAYEIAISRRRPPAKGKSTEEGKVEDDGEPLSEEEAEFDGMFDE